MIRGLLTCAALACLLAVGWPVAGRAGGVPCAPTLRATVPLPSQVDGLLAIGNADSILALSRAARLAGSQHAKQTLWVLGQRDPRVPAVFSLPPSLTLPGLALADDGQPSVYLLLDQALWVLNPGRRRVEARWPLDVQALGWPAALAAGGAGQIYVAGQPRDNRSWAAVVEALVVRRGGPPRLRWRAHLGLTHAGIWLGLAGLGLLAVYVPDANDVSGAMALLDTRSGALRGSYAVPAPPMAVAMAQDRLYLDLAGTVQARNLRTGQREGAITGSSPLAVNSPRRLVALVEPRGIALANATTLRPVAHVRLGTVTALAFSRDGTTLLIGSPSRVAWLTLGTCRAAP